MRISNLSREYICRAAQLRVVRELFESGKALDKETQPRVISLADFKEVMRTRRPSVSPDMVRAYGAWTDNYRAL